MKFKDKMGFSLVELLIVISIISLLSSTVLNSVQKSREKAYDARTKTEARNFNTAIQLYFMDNGKYPCDESRDLPSGIEKYLSTGENNWPDAPYPGSVYDWDYLTPVADAGCGGVITPLDANPLRNKKYYQISIRFCDINGNNCSFPNRPWAVGFDSSSSAYWCISGPCRAHGSKPYTHPGCCFGGDCPSDQPKCVL